MAIPAQEIIAYAAAVEEVEAFVQPLKWWCRHRCELPTLASVLMRILLVQPSRAANESVFSLLNHLFSSHQDSAIEETIEATIMARMNGKCCVLAHKLLETGLVMNCCI